MRVEQTMRRQRSLVVLQVGVGTVMLLRGVPPLGLVGGSRDAPALPPAPYGVIIGALILILRRAHGAPGSHGYHRIGRPRAGCPRLQVETESLDIHEAASCRLLAP